MADYEFETLVEPKKEIGNCFNILLLIYVLYILGIFSCFLFTIVGVVIAYVKRDEFSDDPLSSHFQYLISLFWVTLIWTIIGGVAIILLIGFVILLVIYIYYIVKVLLGLINLLDKKPIK